MKPLYAKDKRDACIIVAVNYRKYDLGDIDEILENQRLTKLSKGIEEYTKLSPKEKAISEEDKKAYLDYLSVFSSNLSTDSNIDTAKKEAASFIKAKYNEQIAVDADKYLFGIEKEKTEKEKMMDTTK